MRTPVIPEVFEDGMIAGTMLYLNPSTPSLAFTRIYDRQVMLVGIYTSNGGWPDICRFFGMLAIGIGVNPIVTTIFGQDAGYFSMNNNHEIVISRLNENIHLKIVLMV